VKSQNNTTIYWTLINHNDWKIRIAATSTGLCFVSPQNRPYEELSQWAEKAFPGCTLEENTELLHSYATQIIEYLEGKRKDFIVSFDFKGTEFQQAVWKALCEIPYGQTKCYSDIANYINKPAAVRAVGAAIGRNPILIMVPCHRVIGKNGALTGFRGGLEMKKQLLDLEQQG
jgi:methylated-DNA-[protein]-cysteine S-methyltransferase